MSMASELKVERSELFKIISVYKPWKHNKSQFFLQSWEGAWQIFEVGVAYYIKVLLMDYKGWRQIRRSRNWSKNISIFFRVPCDEVESVTASSTCLYLPIFAIFALLSLLPTKSIFSRSLPSPNPVIRFFQLTSFPFLGFVTYLGSLCSLILIT